MGPSWGSAVIAAFKQRDPPAGMARESCLALVLTVKGLVVCSPPAPKVVVQVVPPFGMVATKPAQLGPGATPTPREIVDLGIAPAGVQYMVKDQIPAEIVCAGRLVNEKTPTASLMLQAGDLAPAVGLIEPGVHPGAAPVPWRYRGLPAASTTDACIEPHPSTPRARTRAPTVTQPSLRLWRTARADALGGPDCGRGGLRPGGARGPSSHRRSRASRRRGLTASAESPLFGSRDHRHP